MPTNRRESGFTLIELLVVAGLIVVVVATIGTFFLGGPSPAVASAARDIGAAFDEARETAAAFDAATVVFSPTVNGYSARVYRAMPGTPAFAAANGPTYDSAVTIAETAAPLGAPAFAFRIDSRGSVTGYQHFDPASATFTERACPAGGNFVLALAYERQKRTIDVPCAISLAMNTPALTETPPPAVTAPPESPGTCAPNQSCTASLPPFTATCPPGYSPDATQPNVCDTPSPVKHISQAVCSTDPLAGTTDWSVSPPIDYVGTSASPPCPAPPAAYVPTISASPPTSSKSPCPLYFNGVAPTCTAGLIESYAMQTDNVINGPSFSIDLFADGTVCDTSSPCSYNLQSTLACKTGAVTVNSFGGAIVATHYVNITIGNAYSTDIGIVQQAADESGNGNIDTADGYCLGWPGPP